MVATIAEVAGALLDLHKKSPSQARNAYSAVLLIPGFEQVRFHPVLAPYKRLWNTNLQKYGCFWDARPVIAKLASAAGPEATPEEGVSHLRGLTVKAL